MNIYKFAACAIEQSLNTGFIRAPENVQKHSEHQFIIISMIQS